MNILNFQTKLQIAEFLNNEIKEIGITKYRICKIAKEKKLNITQQQVYNVFKGNKNYTIDKLLIILNLLNKC